MSRAAIGSVTSDAMANSAVDVLPEVYKQMQRTVESKGGPKYPAVILVAVEEEQLSAVRTRIEGVLGFVNE